MISFPIEQLPLPLAGMALGLIDGALNPCALSVLFFLVAYLLAIGSKKKCLVLGLIYSFMVFMIYFLFMYGFLNLLFLIGYTRIVKIAIGVILILVSLFEMKDFFFYGKWISLEIPKSAKPKIESFIKKATVPSTLILGILVALVEIPCAGAFPLAYLAMISSKTGIEAAFYIFIYNIFFILPLVCLTVVFYFGFVKIEKAERARLKLRRYMRLISGLVLFVLGLIFLIGWI
ncbi:MAG: hypothetical protein QW040_02305 [Candidatus Aenigmatarchaeota archaeon]